MKVILMGGPLGRQVVEVPENQTFYEAQHVNRGEGFTLTETVLYTQYGHLHEHLIFKWAES